MIDWKICCKHHTYMVVHPCVHMCVSSCLISDGIAYHNNYTNKAVYYCVLTCVLTRLMIVWMTCHIPYNQNFWRSNESFLCVVLNLTYARTFFHRCHSNGVVLYRRVSVARALLNRERCWMISHIASTRNGLHRSALFWAVCSSPWGVCRCTTGNANSWALGWRAHNGLHLWDSKGKVRRDSEMFFWNSHRGNNISGVGEWMVWQMVVFYNHLLLLGICENLLKKKQRWFLGI